MHINHSKIESRGYTNQQRLEIARQLAQLVKERHGNAIAAVVVCGSTSVGLDGPYSDLDMTVVTYANLSDRTKCYTYKGLPINLDYQTVDESFDEARTPYEGGCWRDVLIIHDPDKIVPRLRAANIELSAEACRQAFARAMGDPLVTYVGKARNAAMSGNRQQLVEAAIKFGETCCIALLALNNNQSVTGSIRILNATKELPLLPEKFSELIDVVRSAKPASEQELYDAIEELWAGLRKLADHLSIKWETRELLV